MRKKGTASGRPLAAKAGTTVASVAQLATAHMTIAVTGTTASHHPVGALAPD